MKLTDLSIKSLKAPSKGQKLYFDDAVKGFGVRVSQGGTKTYVLQRGLSRHKRTLGRVGEISLADARKTARTLIAEQTLGKHKAPSLAFSGLRTQFLAASALKHKPRTTAEYKRLLNRVKFGNIQEINPRDISAAITKFKSPAEANHILTALKAIFTFAVQRHYIATNPAISLPLPTKHTPRSRVLSPEELNAVWQALGTDTFSTNVRLLILTGQRRSEIPAIRTLEGNGVIDGAFTKNGLTHIFPLPESALDHIQGDKLFFNGWGKAKTRLDTKSGVKNWTLHDLRRTYATMHAQIGTPIHIIEKLLNHISGTLSGVAGIYNRHTYQEDMAKAVVAYEKHLQKVLTPQP